MIVNPFNLFWLRTLNSVFNLCQILHLKILFTFVAILAYVTIAKVSLKVQFEVHCFGCFINLAELSKVLGGITHEFEFESVTL